MLKKCLLFSFVLSLCFTIPVFSIAGQVNISNGYVTLPSGGGIVFPGGKILDNPDGITGPMGPPGPPGPAATIVSGGNGFGPVSLGAGQTVNVGPISLNLLGGKNILVLTTISPLTWQGSPPAYGGKNHSLHVNVEWKILANGTDELGSFWQTAEQNIIQLHGGGGPTSAMTADITLQAINSSYWRLDDAPGGTTPVGSNQFYVVLSAMEI